MPRLVIRKGEGVGQDHAVSSPCVVGRHSSATFVLGDSMASRNHFRIVQDAGAWFLEDLGSTNGTLLNGQRVKREALRDGDRILAGTTELEFVQKDLLGAVPRARPAAPAVPAAVPAASRLPAAVPAAVPAARPAPMARPAAAVPVSQGTTSSPVVAPPAAKAIPAARPAAPAAPATRPPAPPAPAAPAAPAKPKAQAPIPTKKRR